MRWHFIVTCVVFLVASCRPIASLQVTGVNGFSIGKMDNSQLEADIMIGIKNPNAFGFSIFKSDFDVFLGENKIGVARLNKKVHISANEEKVYQFHFKGDLKSLDLVEVAKMAFSGLKGNVRVKGELRAGRIIVLRKFPVDVTKRLR